MSASGGLVRASIESETIRLIRLIYDAAADGSKWALFLEAFVATIGASRGTLLIRDLDSEELGAVCWYGWSDEDIRLHAEHYARIDPWAIGALTHPEGKAGPDSDLCTREVMEASATFQQFYAPRDAIHGMGGTILVTGTGQSLIAAVRGSASGPFGHLELSLLTSLMPHLKSAALIHGELSSLRRQLATFTSHLDKTPHGLLLTNRERRVLYANSAAKSMTNQRDGLMIDNCRFAMKPGRDTAAFEEALNLIDSNPNIGVLRLEVSRPSRKTPFRLLLLPVRTSKSIPLGVSVPTVSVLIIDADSPSRLDSGILHQLYALTAAESRVTEKLVAGRNVSEIAEDLKISVGTVRTHIKRVLSKTGTDRQAELISLVLRSVPFEWT